MNPKGKIRAFKPPAGEAYGRIEGPKGELGFYLVSDGSANPYRYRVRPPGFINLTVLEDMCLGHTMADRHGHPQQRQRDGKSIADCTAASPDSLGDSFTDRT